MNRQSNRADVQVYLQSEYRRGKGRPTLSLSVILKNLMFSVAMLATLTTPVKALSATQMAAIQRPPVQSYSAVIDGQDLETAVMAVRKLIESKSLSAEAINRLANKLVDIELQLNSQSASRSLLAVLSEADSVLSSINAQDLDTSSRQGYERSVAALAAVKRKVSLTNQAATTKLSSTVVSRAPRVFLDDKPIVFPDQGPVIISGRTLVPVRFVSEALGAEVDWSDATQSVTITQNGSTIVLTLNSRTVRVNSKNQTIDVAPVVIGRRTMVPLRFVSEFLGANVEWNEAQYSVLITRKTSGVVAPIENPTTIKARQAFNALPTKTPDPNIVGLRFPNSLNVNVAEATDFAKRFMQVYATYNGNLEFDTCEAFFGVLEPKTLDIARSVFVL